MKKLGYADLLSSDDEFSGGDSAMGRCPTDEDDRREIFEQVAGRGLLPGFTDVLIVQSLLRSLERKGSTSLLALINAMRAYVSFMQTQADIVNSRRVRTGINVATGQDVLFFKPSFTHSLNYNARTHHLTIILHY